MIAFIFPGQGSQKVGMGRALAEAYAEARDAMAEADAAFAAADPSGPVASLRDEARLSRIVLEGPEERLTLTEHAQPAILAVSTAAARVLAREGIEPAYVAGHSLGEYSAHVAAGTIGFADAVGIVRRRGRYMQEAVPVGQGAMAAILGADAALVTRACEEAAAGEVVAPANINAPGQIVIAGTAAAVSRASERAKALGARRAVPLPVSAPFHCALMRPAETRLAPELRALPVQPPRVPVVANVDALPKREAAPAIDALVRQVSSPVLWEAVVRRLALEGVTTYVEVGPGTVLSGLVRKIQPDARVLHFGSPEDLGAVVTACSISAEKSPS
jgi:[acyl-carrier-protein] S-malonyltransferase